MENTTTVYCRLLRMDKMTLGCFHTVMESDLQSPATRLDLK